MGDIAMKSQIIKQAFLILLAVSGLVQAQETELATGVAELRQLPREFRLDGVVEAVNRSTVSAQTSGQVQEIRYDVDDFVEQDAVLVVLKDTEQQSRVVRSAADLKEAVARLEEARDAHQRTKEVFAKQLVAESAMDQAEAALKSATARFEAAEAGLSQAKEQLEYTRIKAPFAGIVTERHVEAGEMAQPGQPLLSGISLDLLRVSVDVPQTLVPRIREQGQARVQLPVGGSVEAAKLTIFPYADPGSNTFKVRLELAPGTSGLFPGMFVKTSFVTGMKQELVLPISSVVQRSEVTGVYVVDDTGRVHFRHLRAGRRTLDGGVLVLAGIEPGERVALDPIAAGAKLKRQREEQRDE